jgi:hypothetical protein
MNAWPVRAGMLALLVLIGLRGADRVGGAPRPPLAAAARVLDQAGFRVRRVTARTWGDRAIPGDTFLLASHPLCNAAVEIRQASIANLNDPAMLAVRGIMPSFAYGTWSGAAPSRLRLLAETARLQLRYAIGPGLVAPPDSRLLVIIDPSACLTIAAPDWTDAF